MSQSNLPSPTARRGHRLLSLRPIWSAGALLLLLIALVPTGSAANLSAPGIPLLQSFGAEQGFPINGRFASFTQSIDGEVFVADRDNLLRFDGVRFSEIDLPQGRYLTVAADDRDRIYYAGYNRIGYLAPPDNNGGRAVVDLRAGLPEWLADDFTFHRMEAIRDGMLLLGRRHIIRMDRDDRVTHVFPLPDGARGFTSMEYHRGRLFVSVSDMGIVEVVDRRMTVLPGTEGIAAHYSLNEMFHLGDDSLLVVSEDRGLYLYDGRRARRINGAFSTYVDENGAMGAVMLDNGDMAVATYYGGVALGNWNGQLYKVITKEYGLSANNSNGGLLLDREDGLWVSTFEGIDRLLLGSGFTAFNEAHGFEGIPYEIQPVGRDIIIGTTISAYHLQPGQGALGADRFQELTGIHGAVVGVLPMDNSLYVASNVKMHRVTLRPPGVYDVRGEPQTGAFVTAATPDGHRAFVIQNRDIYIYQTWGLRSMSIVDTLNFDKPSVALTALCPTDDELWIVRDSGDLTSRTLTRFNIRIDADEYGQVVDYGPTDGLPTSGQLIPFTLDGQLLLATGQGFFRFLRGQGGFVPADVLNEAATAHGVDITHVQTDDRGRIWYLTGDSQGHRLNPSGDTYVHTPLPAMALDGQVRSFRVNEAGTVAWGGLSTGSLVRFEEDNAADPLPITTPILSRVAIHAATFATDHDSLLFGGQMPAGMPRRGLPASQANLRFEYALPLANSFGLTQYRTRMRGLTDTWSPWTHEAYRDYTTLFEGNYTFDVQARDNLGRVSPVQSYSFVVRPPWWRTIFAGVFVAAVVLGFYFLVVWLRDRRAAVRQQELEDLIEQRSEELSGSRDQEMALHAELQRWSDRNRMAVTVAQDVALPLEDVDEMLKGIYQSRALTREDRRVLIRVKQALDHIGDSLQHICQLDGSLDSTPEDIGQPYLEDPSGYSDDAEMTAEGDAVYQPDSGQDDYAEGEQGFEGDYGYDPQGGDPSSGEYDQGYDDTREQGGYADPSGYQEGSYEDSSGYDDGGYDEPAAAEPEPYQPPPLPRDHSPQRGERQAMWVEPGHEPRQPQQRQAPPEPGHRTPQPEPDPEPTPAPRRGGRMRFESAEEAVPPPAPRGRHPRFQDTTPADETYASEHDEPEDSYEPPAEPVRQAVWREPGTEAPAEEAAPEPAAAKPEVAFTTVSVAATWAEDVGHDDDDDHDEWHDEEDEHTAEYAPGEHSQHAEQAEYVEGEYAVEQQPYHPAHESGEYAEGEAVEGEYEDEWSDEDGQYEDDSHEQGVYDENGELIDFSGRPPGAYSPFDPSQDVWHHKGEQQTRPNRPSPRSVGVPLPPSLKRRKR